MTALLERLDADPRGFTNDETAELFGTTRSALESCGLLCRAPDETHDTCDGCDHVGEVVRVETGGAVYLYLPCPSCGPQQVPPERLRRWEVSVDGLIAEIRRCSVNRDSTVEVIRGSLWRLGWANWDGRSRELFFVHPAGGASEDAVAEYLVGHSGAIVLTTTEKVLVARGARWPHRRLALASLASLVDGSLAIDAERIDYRKGEWRESPPQKPSKPPPKRASRATNIEKLEDAMAEHLRAAKNHAWAMKDLTWSPKLLKRPTMEVLGKPFGLGKTDVHRCIRDPSAKVLKLYWKAANDLEAIMKWRDRRRRKKKKSD